MGLSEAGRGAAIWEAMGWSMIQLLTVVGVGCVPLG